MTNQWRIELLGGLRVGHGEHTAAPLPYQKSTALLAYLAYYPHHPHPRETLIELLWPEVKPEAGQRNLRVALHTLRRFLEEKDPSASELLVARRTTIHLDAADFKTDVTEFRAAVRTAAETEALRPHAEALGAAVALYGGELLPGFFEPWVLTEREHLAGSYLAALQQLVRAREELGDFTGALAAARQAVAADPLREEAHYDVMRLYAATGQPSACLHQYQELERLLREELGEVPSAEARALAEELQQNARRLVVARRAPAGRGDGATGQQEDRTDPGSLSHSLTPSPPHSLTLPLPLTRFFGREEESTRLTELLDSRTTRLVTVTGPGGSGKTRLAIAVAGRLQEQFGEGVTFIALAELTDAGRLMETIADALGRERSPGAEPLAQVAGHLRDRRWLLVLDNFEQLVETGAVQIRTLLERTPTLTCLVTSRQRLGISGEQEFALLPLPTPRIGGVRCWVLGVESEAASSNTQHPTPNTLLRYPSVQLFVDRARAARADFKMTPENAAAVAELCDRLEGLPLAIELAAARAEVLSPAQMLEQLAGRFEFLVSRQRDLPARHRTLRAAIDASFEALSPSLRPFFACLSVFRGGWTLEAAQAVCGDFGFRVPITHSVGTRRLDFGLPANADEPDHPEPLTLSDPIQNPNAQRAPEIQNTLDALQQLRDSSLVIAEERAGELRFRLLETLREYAAARLSAEERAAVMDRHLAFFLEMAERVHQAPGQSGDLAGTELLQRDYPNFQAGLEWGLAAEERGEQSLRLAARLDKLWNRRMTDGRRWLAAALAHAPAAPLALRAEALSLAGHLAGRQNDLSAARAALEESLALWRQAGDRERVAETLVELALCARGAADLAGAQRYLEECVAIRQAGGDREGAAWALENLAWVVARRGETGAAIRLLQESLATGRACGAVEIVAYSLQGLGWLAAQQDNLPEALALLEESLEAARELAREPLRITHRSGIQRDWAHMDLGQARILLEQSLAFNRVLKHQWLVMHILGALGHIARQQGDYGGARAYYQESLRVRRELGELFAVAQAIEDLAALNAEQGEPEPATRLLGAAEALCETLGVQPPVAMVEAYHQAVAAARAALGETVFSAIWAEGRTLSLEQAVKYAQGDL